MEKQKEVFRKDLQFIDFIHPEPALIDLSSYSQSDGNGFYLIHFSLWCSNLYHIVSMSAGERDQPVQFMSNSTFVDKWRKKHICVWGLTLAVRQRKNGHFYSTISPLLWYFPDLFLCHTWWKRRNILFTWKKIVCFMRQR